MANIFSRMLTAMTGLPTDGLISDSLDRCSLPSRNGLSAVISREVTQSGVVPGVGPLDGGGAHYVSMPNNKPNTFRFDYKVDGIRGIVLLDAEELADARKDMAWQRESFTYVEHLPEVVSNKISPITKDS